jgi:hypothetical protein
MNGGSHLNAGADTIMESMTDLTTMFETFQVDLVNLDRQAGSFVSASRTLGCADSNIQSKIESYATTTKQSAENQLASVSAFTSQIKSINTDIHKVGIQSGINTFVYIMMALVSNI